MKFEIRDQIITITADEHFSMLLSGENSGKISSIIDTERIDKCIFDFKKTSLIDSTGIGCLVSLAKLCSENDTLLILENMNRELVDLFTDAGLDRLFIIDQTNDEKMLTVKEFFKKRTVDVKLDIEKKSAGDIGIFKLAGIMSHPLGTNYFKQQFLLFLSEYRNILLDFEDLTYFDSLSVSSVLSMNNLLKGTGGSLRICSPNFIIRDLLNTLCIDTIIPVFNCRDEALADWSTVNGF